jgi:hypothetical protein
LKNILNALFIFLAGAVCMLAYSCEKKEIVFEGPYYVRFSDSTAFARESFNEPIKIAVHNVGPQLDTRIKVKYVVSGTAREGIDYRIEGTKGEVIIPSGESFGYITLQLLNNSNNILESQNVVFTIIEVSPENLRIGTSTDGIIGRSTTFTIIDDCILSGSYTGTRQGSRVAQSGVAITSSDCKEYILSNWNIDLITYPSVAIDLRFIDNGDNTLTIPPQLEERFEEPRDTIQGFGSVNPLNGTLSFNVQLEVAARNGSDSTITIPFTYTPE